jgi:hypothetical protein
MSTLNDDKPFSAELESWLKSKQPKTFASLDTAFGEKSFALASLLLMILPATPLPTGFVTHIFEIIVMLLSLQLIIGRRTIWLPGRLKRVKLDILANAKSVPTIVGRVQWLERHSSARGRILFESRAFLPFIGLFMLLFTVGAFVAPPFTGLDTLPALGVVIISLAIILEDGLLLLFGSLIGAFGVGLVIALGGATLHFVQRLL